MAVARRLDSRLQLPPSARSPPSLLARHAQLVTRCAGGGGGGGGAAPAAGGDGGGGGGGGAAAAAAPEPEPEEEEEDMGFDLFD